MPPFRSSSQVTKPEKSRSIYSRYPKQDQFRIVSKLYPKQDHSRIISELYPKQDQSRFVSDLYLKHFTKEKLYLIQTQDQERSRGTVEEIPPEIWREIGKRLQSRLDVLRFRSVCRTWRSSLPPPSLFPLRVPPPPAPSPSLKGAPTATSLKGASFFITELTYYAANQMIVVLEEDCRGGKFSASALVYEEAFLDMKFKIRPISNLSSSSGLSFLSNGYRLHKAYRSKKRNQGKSDTYVRKTVIISNSNANSDSNYYYYVNPNFVSNCDLTVVALLYNNKLAVLRLRGGAMNNTWETDFCNSVFEDIVNYRDQLYAIDKSGLAFVMDFHPLRMIPVAPLGSEFNYYVGKPLYLVVSSGVLYAFHVMRHNRGYYTPMMFKLHSRIQELGLQQEWVTVLEQEVDGVFFVQHVHCNFVVERDLFEEDYYHTRRVLKWPEFEFVRIVVGCKNGYKRTCKCAMVHRAYGLNKYQYRCSCREVEVEFDGHLWIK